MPEGVGMLVSSLFTFFLFSKQFLPVKLVLSPQGPQISVLAQMVEYSDRQQKKKELQ